MIPGVRAKQHVRNPSRCDAPLNVMWAGQRKAARLPRRGPKRDGVVFENEVHLVLKTVSPPWYYLPSPWISYDEDGVHRHAQPDGLLINFRTGEVVCCEMKLRHTARAHTQLMGKYAPLLAQLFPAPLWRLHFVEIYKVWDFVDTKLVLTESWELGGWAGAMCYGWRGVLPL